MDREQNSYTYKLTTNICDFLHQYIVDIFGSLIPGCAFLLAFEMFLRLNAPIVKLLFLDSPGASIINSIMVCVDYMHDKIFISLMVAYLVGVLFTGRSLQQPDSISQIVRTLDKSYKTGIVSMMVYFLVCCLGSIKKFIFAFNAHIRKDCAWCRNYFQRPEKVSQNNDTRTNASGNADSATGATQENDTGETNSTTSEGRKNAAHIVHSFLCEGRLPDKTKIETKDEKIALRIVTGDLRIWHCIFHFIKREIGLYAVMLLYIFLLTFAAFVAEKLIDGYWYVGIVVVVGLTIVIIYYSAPLRHLFIRTKGELPWRDCGHKESYKNEGEVYQEFWNRCAFLKAQLVRYPYEDFYDVYLKVRDCAWLEQYGWARKHDQYGADTRYRKCANLRMIESMKLRLYQCVGLNTQNLRRLEAQVRLVGTIWHMSKFFILLSWTILFSIITFGICQITYKKIIDHEEPVVCETSEGYMKTMASKTVVVSENQVVSEEIITHEERLTCEISTHKGGVSLLKKISDCARDSKFLSILSAKEVSLMGCFYRNLALFIAAFIVNYSISSFFHFLRLKEVHHILELFNHYVRTFKKYNNGIPGQTCAVSAPQAESDAKSCTGDTMLNEGDFYRFYPSKACDNQGCGSTACARCAERADGRTSTVSTPSAGAGHPGAGADTTSQDTSQQSPKTGSASFEQTLHQATENQEQENSDDSENEEG